MSCFGRCVVSACACYAYHISGLPPERTIPTNASFCVATALGWSRSHGLIPWDNNSISSASDYVCCIFAVSTRCARFACIESWQHGDGTQRTSNTPESIPMCGRASCAFNTAQHTYWGRRGVLVDSGVHVMTSVVYICI